MRLHRGLDHLELPIRHGEGKFFAAPEVLAESWTRGQIALKYATADGSEAGGRFPDNPNGSLLDIAGVCDATGRVLGLMPHPEAHVTSIQHPTWTREKEAWRRRGQPYPEQEGAGLAIFRNAVKYMEGIFKISREGTKGRGLQPTQRKNGWRPSRSGLNLSGWRGEGRVLLGPSSNLTFPAAAAANPRPAPAAGRYPGPRPRCRAGAGPPGCGSRRG